MNSVSQNQNYFSAVVEKFLKTTLFFHKAFPSQNFNLFLFTAISKIKIGAEKPNNVRKIRDKIK